MLGLLRRLRKLLVVFCADSVGFAFGEDIFEQKKIKGMIRRAEISDVSEMVDCVDAAYSSARGRGIELPPVSEELDQDIRDHLVWVSLEGNRIIGIIVVAVNADQAHLVNIAVHPAAAGKGIAKSLIETCLAELRRLDVRQIDLATHIDMPENVSLYSHLGWIETGRTANKVYMSRALV